MPRRIVLVIEDDDEVRKMLFYALPQLGYDVRVASSGTEGVALYRSQPAHLVLCDVRMPDMDGPATLQALQKIDPKVICCFITGHSGTYSTDELLAFGAVV